MTGKLIMSYHELQSDVWWVELFKTRIFCMRQLTCWLKQVGAVCCLLGLCWMRMEVASLMVVDLSAHDPSLRHVSDIVSWSDLIWRPKLKNDQSWFCIVGSCDQRRKYTTVLALISAVVRISPLSAATRPLTSSPQQQHYSLYQVLHLDVDQRLYNRNARIRVPLSSTRHYRPVRVLQLRLHDWKFEDITLTLHIQFIPKLDTVKMDTDRRIRLPSVDLAYVEHSTVLTRHSGIVALAAAPIEWHERLQPEPQCLFSDLHAIYLAFAACMAIMLPRLP